MRVATKVKGCNNKVSRRVIYKQCIIFSDNVIDSTVLKSAWLLVCVSVVYYLLPFLYIKRGRIGYIGDNTRKKRVMRSPYIEQ
jgi:hypothetical protein